MVIKRRQRLSALSIIGPILVSGCVSLGPDYVEPVADVEKDWAATDETYISTGSPKFDTSKWWATSFNDPELDQLVSQALTQNLSLRSAGLRVLQSQQQLAIAIGNQYPQQQQLVGSGGREKEGGVIFNLSLIHI